MKIKKFSNFILNENNSDSEFRNKILSDYTLQSEAKSVISITLEDINNKLINAQNYNDFRDTVIDNMNIDATNLLDFSIDDQISLCIIAEDEGYGKCPETSWDYLSGVINNYAINGLTCLIQEIFDNSFSSLEKFMKVNKLNYSDITSKDTYGYAAPKSVKPIENGEVYQYRKLDGEFDVDVYIYINDELNITLYVNKKL